MRMDPATEARVSAALDTVWSAAADAKAASDLATMKAALNRVWFATHKAQDTINEADAMTRKAALARIGEAA